MNKEELKAVQTPLKEKHKTNSETAIITLQAIGNLNEGVSCSVDTGKVGCDDLHPSVGVGIKIWD